MTEEQTLRKSVIQESQNFGTKKRFGLFSQPISIAIGDNGQYKKKAHPRDPGNNKPLTQPRNFYVSPNKSGQGQSAYFGKFNPLASSQLKDEYLQSGKRLLKQQKQARDKGRKQMSFFTGTGNKIIAKPAYVYMEQNNPQLNPKRNRDSDGKVKSELKNFYTNQTSTVENTLFKQCKHIEDPYNRASKLETDRNKRNKSLQGEQSFRPNSFNPKLLNSQKSIYGQDVELKNKQPKETKFNIYNHQGSWKSSSPNRKGLYGYFEPFPVYMENPLKSVTRKPPQEKHQSFKLNSSELSTPSPSISLNRSNLRRSMGKH